MKILLDTSIRRAAEAGFPNELVIGQLITPLTGFKRWAETFAIDNGAFTRFNAKGFRSILEREQAVSNQCLFVCCPDIVGNARRTLEIYSRKYKFIPASWKAALVAQDGLEDLEVPWHDLECLFIGGKDPWKDSQCAKDLVRTAKILGKHVHVGRVNSVERYRMFAELGADTCDGSGIARYINVKMPEMQKAFDDFKAFESSETDKQKEDSDAE